MVARCRLLAAHIPRSCLSVRTQPLTATCAPSQTSTIPWACYRRRNQWLRLALALFCLPLIWLARVVYLTYVEATVFGVGMHVGCDGCNNDGARARDHTMPCHTIPYQTMPYHNTPYHTKPYHTIPYHTMYGIAYLACLTNSIAWFNTRKPFYDESY